LLTDGKNAPIKLFNDHEVVYYESIDDAIEKVNYYLRNDEERIDIAQRGQIKTLSEFNAEKSAKKLYDFFESYLK
ncbi:MAG TPA: glycosyltransferase, partial [Chitinophagaceae bacterium]|nr:glycosyltransferase [Chitinophagaceae bacterium]